MNQSAINSQNPQQQIQGQFHLMAQQFQAGNLSAEQTNTNSLPQGPLAHGILIPRDSSSASGSAGTPPGSQVHGHGHRHHGFPQDDPGSEAANSPSLGQLGQAIQATNSSSAQQTYGSVSQDLQQIALNSDLITAQSAALQASTLSLTA